MIESIGTSTSPLAIYPLKRQDARILWMAVRYRIQMNNLKEVAQFRIDLPESWLDLKVKKKKGFKKKG